MSYWAFGFFAGALLGLNTDLFVQSRIEVICMLVMFCGLYLKYKHKKNTLFLMSFFWGAVNHAPYPNFSKKDVSFEVVNVAPLGWYKYSPSLVRIEKDIFLVQLDHKDASFGELKSKRQSGVFQQYNAYLASKHSRSVQQKVSMFENIALKIKEYINSNVSLLPIFYQRWIKAIYLGELLEIEQELKSWFFLTGTIHLLVVSGMHVGFFSMLFAFILMFPLRILYLCLVLNPKTYLKYFSLMEVVSVFFAILYCYLVGFSIPVQRSIVIFATLKLCQLFLGELPLNKKLLICFVIHSILFPVGLVGDTLLLSWGAYVLVILANVNRDGIKSRICNYVKSQFYMILLIGVKFNLINLISFGANLILVPLFTIVYLSCAYLAFFAKFSNATLLQINFAIHIKFLAIVEFFSEIAKKNDFLQISINEEFYFIKIILFMTITVFVLNEIEKLPIHKQSKYLIK